LILPTPAVTFPMAIAAAATSEEWVGIPGRCPA
jgi:hypothetical protein